jgi:sigma-B regulation protein RsbU (phosphoserine phosphatase)
VVRTTEAIVERYPVLRTIPTFSDQGLLAMPLRSAEGIAGAATWVFEDPHPIDDADLAFVGLVTEQAAVAIARMRAQAESAAASLALSEREAELGEYRARLEALADADVIGVISGEGDRITVANRAFLRLIGLDALPAEGLPFTEITPPEWEASDAEVVRQMLEVGHAEPFEKEYLTAEGERVWVLIGGTTLSNDPFTWIVYVADISDRKRAEAAVLEANQALADLLARQRHIADSLQRHLLPDEVPALAGTELSAHYWPSADDLEVSGDLYDAFPLSGSRWGLLVGDVCGKGAEAAAVIGAARHTARAAALHVDDPADVLRWVHAAVHAAHRTFVTMAFATYDDRDGRFQLSLGGHPRGLLIRATGEVEHVGTHGTLLGLLPPELHTTEHQLGTGDLLVLFTDGITDAPPAEAMGESELGDWFAVRRGEPLESLGEQLRAELARRRPEGPGDDVAVLLARRR